MADLGTRIQSIAHDVALEIMAEFAKDVSKQLAESIEKRLRAEMAGDRGYISSESTATKEAKKERARRMFNGRNATEVAREIGVGRATVYRMLKRPG